MRLSSKRSGQPTLKVKLNGKSYVIYLGTSMPLFILSILLSAFLLFQVQPLVGKMILPWFGGTSAVWSAALLFFQVLLTGGYAYAYWLVGRAAFRKQGKIHLVLLGAAFLVLLILAFVRPSPITPISSMAGDDIQFPIWNIFKVLALSVGLPYFVLATNSTIIQAWFVHNNPQRSPYWLYAVSNAGSLIALLSYPFLFEPVFPLVIQGWIWATGFLLFLILSGLIVLSIKSTNNLSLNDSPKDNSNQESKPPLLHQLVWIALSATASVLLLSTTSKLTQEVAPIPFLWVLPLSVYLLSFIITFSGESRYYRPIFTTLLALASIGIVLNNRFSNVHFFTQIAVYTLFLFTSCLVAHGELYKLRPGADTLPRFYLLVSVGGALGGLAVNLAAPALFRGYWEFYLGWAALLVLLVVLLFIRPTENLPLRWKIGHDFFIEIQAILVVIYSIMAVGAISKGNLFQERNFYGVSMVYLDTSVGAYRFIHGTTVHGLQFIDAEKRAIPTSYFWEQSGIARIIRSHPRYGKGLRVGILGLGIGTLADYGQPGDAYRFYEINPDVIELASGYQGYFSFLEDSQAEIAIVQGDARIQLERELRIGERQEFDLLVMDAFSSDAVPVHLLTQEAFELYLQHLSPDGVIAVNITNRYLDLQPVIWLAAQHFGLYTAHFSTPAPEDNPTAFYSEWMLLTNDPALLDAPEIAEAADLMEDYTTDIQLWTDDYSNLFQILNK